MNGIKPGRTTSEIGVLGLVSGLLALNDKLAGLPPHVLYTIAGLAAVYIVSRTWLKVTAAKPAPLVLESDRESS